MVKKLISLLLLLISLMTIGLCSYSGIFPLKYLGILIGVYLVIDVISIFAIKSKKKILFIVGLLLSLVMILLSIAISFILIRWHILFDNVSSNNEEVDGYALVVLNTSTYTKLSDIKDKDLGILKTNDDTYNGALELLSNKVSTKYKEYENNLELAVDLLNGKIEVIFLKEAYIAILNEGINNFSDKIKELDVINITTKEIVTSDPKVNIDENAAFNIYISGIDTYGTISNVSRSDVNIIATINPNTGKILLTNIPRDMYVPLYGTTGLKDKLTHAGVYGIDTSVKTIEEFLDIDISYYVRINFNTLISLVDYIGGIDVYSDYSFKTWLRSFQKGMNYNLTGKEALAFSRNRYAFSDGDRQRGRNQERVIAAIIDKVTKSYDLNTYLNLLSVLENSFQTNMDIATINKFINKQLENNYRWNIEFSDVSGFDSYDYTYSYPWQKLYVMLVDENSLNNAKEKINNVLEEK